MGRWSGGATGTNYPASQGTQTATRCGYETKYPSKLSLFDIGMRVIDIADVFRESANVYIEFLIKIVDSGNSLLESGIHLVINFLKNGIKIYLILSRICSALISQVHSLISTKSSKIFLTLASRRLECNT